MNLLSCLMMCICVQSEWKQVTSNDGSWLVQWRIVDEGKPAELPRVRKRFSLEVQIAPTGEQKDAPRAVFVDAQMPEHMHGMNVAPLVVLGGAPAGGANVTAEGMLFHMSGRWEVDLDIDDGTTCERAQWNITLP